MYCFSISSDNTIIVIIYEDEIKRIISLTQSILNTKTASFTDYLTLDIISLLHYYNIKQYTVDNSERSCETVVFT